MDNVIEINGLTKDYDVGFWRKRKVRALDGLDLAVSRGQIFGFIGGNGAGKTTTIKILMSLLFSDAGSAKILGRDISDRSMHSRIGYCPENPYFYDYLSASELMLYFGRLAGLSIAEAKVKRDSLLDLVGIEERDRGRQLRKYSKGMLQRVGIAQALIGEPEVVFLDEPMSGLDPIGRRDVRNLVASLRTKGVTVFMSTHILSDIEALCDNVAIMRKGRLAATGRLSELLGSGEGDRFEICVKRISADTATRIATGVAAELSVIAEGAIFTVRGEQSVLKIINSVNEAGGSLVSVTPVRQSLEQLFSEKAG
ncbi:MAG: ABC transporter ATP-binding protein [Acidobacteriota bacterium]